MFALETIVPEVVPPRSIVVLEPDTSDVHDAENRIREAVAARGLEIPDWDRWTHRYQALRALVVPVDEDNLRDANRVGTNGVIAIDHERFSLAPPGKEPDLDERLAITDPLDVTGVLRSSFTGRGQTVMVLDSGFFSDHPDFKTRRPAPTIETFVPNTDPRQDSGHGTRSVGLACGPFIPFDLGPRYGVAYEADIFFGRVADIGGQIFDAALLDAFEAAITRVKPAVINMSCGSEILKKVPYSTSFELIAQRVLKKGILLVAAAGNGAPNFPVNHPANCPSVMAVAALDANLQPSRESCSRENCDGEVDLAAPGFEIRSSTTRDLNLYNRKTGTSSAAALVSGIATLWAHKGFRGCDLWNALMDHTSAVVNGTRKLTGAGMVQAP